jgi:V-type H+-transporting ATPase proteolipid subunit
MLYYAAYSSGVTLVALAAIGLYLMLTGQGQYFDIGGFLLSTSPYMWATFGISLCISLSVVGAAWFFLTERGVDGAGESF